MLSKEEREAIAKAAGGLPEEAIDEIDGIIERFRSGEGDEMNRVMPETRETIRLVQIDLKGVVAAIERLQLSLDYRRFNADGVEDTSLASHLEGLASLSDALANSENRLKKRSRKNWMLEKVKFLFIELSEIRARCLQVNVPTQMKEATSGGLFHGYLRLCLHHAWPEATKSEKETYFANGLERAVKVFQWRQRPEYSWEWDETFPQSEHMLRRSRKFLRG